ncbi:adenylate isopentenyltransferase [Eucalyptus grandis]|uniref:adenylate isopentenyltransferase n=1 Tax=Eucalyptus grandis TaxID=71139 RepID=UPI00192E8B18|nr:adenylate isopentenyltransferase [Eucalyptus grandis]
MASSSAAAHCHPKVVIIMGATGCGKSRLSIDLASHFRSAEVINSDKMQVYRGLDITTNKIAPADRRGVPHHLLGSLDPDDGEMTPSQFRSLGDAAISDVASRGSLPLLVGGSTSSILALLAERFVPEEDVFGGLGPPARPELRYHCCFLWVDVSLPILKKCLPKRVDGMLRMGAFDELARYYDLRRTDPGGRAGLRKAIGVPEFDQYFEKYPPRGVGPGDAWEPEDARERDNDPVREGAYQEALREIKKNAGQLMKRQIMKIRQLSESGWELHRLDATEAVRLATAPEEEDVWKRQVLEPSVEIVNQFLQEK